MGLDPVTEKELETLITRFNIVGGEGYETRIESTTGVMIASSVYETALDRTWFVRVTTTPEAGERVQESVFSFGRSILGSSLGDG